MPGYSFPRLPLSAYIPGTRQERRRDEFLTRARFLAISEFGPRAIEIMDRRAQDHRLVGETEGEVLWRRVAAAVLDMAKG